MKDEALDELCSRYGLASRPRRQLASLLEGLERDEHAPTAVREAARAAEIHLADSLVALELEPIREARRVADLGAGAGFPGLALAAALPRCQFWLVESQQRRCAFIDALAFSAAIENARSVWSRAEEWRSGADSHDVVLARALAHAPVVLEYAAPLLRLGGLLVDWRGRRDQAMDEAALRAAAILGLELQEVRRVDPFSGARDRHLHLYRKVTVTPDRFPRRAGIARKRPLAATSDRDRR